MASQNDTGRQFDKRHAVTVVAQEAIPAHRFVTFEGKVAATATPHVNNPEQAVQGISEEAAASGDALSVVTDYSYLVEAAANIPFGAYVKPNSDGRAIVGTQAECCGRALGAGDGSGSHKPLIEVQILTHNYTAATG